MRTHRRLIRNRKTFRGRFRPQREDIATSLELERFKFGSPSDGDGVSRRIEKSLLGREKRKLPTQQDLHERKEHQFERFLQLRNQGKLNLPDNLSWREYGARHRREIANFELSKLNPQADNQEISLPRKEVF